MIKKGKLMETKLERQAINAIESNDIEVVKALLNNGLDINCIPVQAGVSFAIRNNKKDMIKLLIDEGLNVNRGFIIQELIWLFENDKNDTFNLLYQYKSVIWRLKHYIEFERKYIYKT